jgi:hypothetical protein
VDFPGIPGFKPTHIKITVFHAEKSCYLNTQDSLPAESKSWAVAPAQCHCRIGGLVRARWGDDGGVRYTWDAWGESPKGYALVS